jgi:cell division protein FtsL
METLILNNGTKKDLDLLLDIAKKLGLNLSIENKSEKEVRYERLRKLAKKLDSSVKPNNITMEEIVEEVRLVREERKNYGKENNS